MGFRQELVARMERVQSLSQSSKIAILLKYWLRGSNGPCQQPENCLRNAYVLVTFCSLRQTAVKTFMFVVK